MSTILSYHWTSDQEKLEAFVLDRIDKKERALLVAHLEKCEECSRRVQEERELLAGIRRFGRLEMKRRLKMRLRRDRGRRFEWTQAASLAAAIVVMLGAVFAIRWFIDSEQSKTRTREIILSENKESKPAERALWIIGKIVEIREKPVRSKDLMADRRDRSFADRDQVQAETVASESVSKEVASLQVAKPKEEATLAAQRQPESRDTSTSIAFESGKLDTIRPMAVSETRALNLPRSDVRGKSNSVERRQAAARLPGTREPGTSDSAEKKMEAAPVAYDRLEYITPDSSKAKRSLEMSSLAKSETPATPQVAAKARQTLMAEEKPASHSGYVAKRELKPAPRKGRPIKNIVVRRGDMNELPASMRSRDASAVQTRLEKTSEGMVLTFYSNMIKDSVATSVEAVASDSIVVTFRTRQIIYQIPGGLGGKM